MLNHLLSSNQTLIFLFFSVLAIVISIIQYESVKIVIIQMVIYYLILEDINCKLHGNCNIAAWIATLVPLAGLIIFILDYLNIFKNIRDKINKLFLKYEEISYEGKLNLDLPINDKNRIIPI